MNRPVSRHTKRPQLGSMCFVYLVHVFGVVVCDLSFPLAGNRGLNAAVEQGEGAVCHLVLAGLVSHNLFTQSTFIHQHRLLAINNAPRFVGRAVASMRAGPVRPEAVSVDQSWDCR